MRIRCWLCRAWVFALVAVGCAPPALASDAITGKHGSAFLGAFAGYEKPCCHGGPSFMSATTTFKVPKLKCSARNEAIAPGIYAIMPNGMAYGSAQWGASLFVGCHGGRARYWPELEVNNAVRNYGGEAAHAGDVIVVRLDTRSGVSVVDETHRFKLSRRGSGTGPVSGAIGTSGWIIYGHHARREPFPNFGTLTYSHTTVKGQRFRRWLATRVSQRHAGVLQIATGQPFDDGTAFRTYFKHS